MGVIVSIVMSVVRFIVGWITGRRENIQQELGAAKQRDADNAKVQKEVELAHEVENRVDAAGDPELERMRDKWTR